MSTQAAEQALFINTTAAKLAKRLPGELVREAHKSGRYAYFGDTDHLVLMVGAEAKDVNWALAYGLAEALDRRLVLVLPEGSTFATQQRAPWLTDQARPEIWVHNGQTVSRTKPFTRDDTIANVVKQAKKASRGAPAAELAAASTPTHLGAGAAGVSALVEWATSHPQLDAGHRQGDRSWLCAGLKVLSLKSGRDGVQIRAGVHDGPRSRKADLRVGKGEELTAQELSGVIAGVQAGITARLSRNGKHHKPDEHWFQSVLRRDPSLVGLESPALREVPAWRPAAARGTFGRGLLDLLGLDGNGDMRLVEAKLAKSTDDMTLLQGVDYYVWARAYEDALRDKLSAPRKARLRLHYAVGQTESDRRLLPPRVGSYSYALDTDAVPFTFHVVTGWAGRVPDARPQMTTTAFDANKLP